MDIMERLTEEELKRFDDCKSEQDWDAACTAVKAARNGKYPHDWYAVMLASGRMQSIVSKFGGDAKIRIM